MPQHDRAGSTISVILEAFSPLAGKRILDVGCGAGALAIALAPHEALVTGVDPNGEAVAAARRAAPGAKFHQARAEALPFADGSFDGAVFQNSLHHVPEDAMDRALREAARVVAPGGPIVVVEPLAEGSFFAVLHTAEDETRARNAAQRCLARAVEGGEFEQVLRSEYLRLESFTGPDEFVEHVVAVDPARAGAAEERRREIEAAFRYHSMVDADGRMILEQPMRAYILRARTA